ncbi:hypothetical protein SADUNF_Sadunf06G0011500 [Salix dunnii]|uniref:NADH-ubiquinone oxidoreductase 21kDa subunit N-terminal domain-containing protein n=1 Tax=Salix dunnii TaxID=1413687 RepID=A0A835MUI9_9ROSI|nr:hypothetical protein SADUNF_Sadunf06G0011500 [Salix dunnii]
MNTDITASAKPEYPVIDRNPAFSKVVGNFNTLDYCRFITLTGVSVTVGYLSGIKPGIKGPSMVTGGLIGLMGGFMYAYQNSAGRLMGFFPNEEGLEYVNEVSLTVGLGSLFKGKQCLGIGSVDCHVIFVGSKDRNWQVCLSHVLLERYYCVDFLAKLGSSQADRVLVEWLFPHPVNFIHCWLWNFADAANWKSCVLQRKSVTCLILERHSQKQCIYLDVAFTDLESFCIFPRNLLVGACQILLFGDSSLSPSIRTCGNLNVSSVADGLMHVP